MIHASIELIEAMAGTAPWANALDFDAHPGQLDNACGALGEKIGHTYHTTVIPIIACDGYAASTGLEAMPPVDGPSISGIDCPRCLVAMDAARDGVVLR